MRKFLNNPVQGEEMIPSKVNEYKSMSRSSPHIGQARGSVTSQPISFDLIIKPGSTKN